MDRQKTIIFWGALWGILEASLGWFLHLIHFKGEVLILYPFGLMCMLMAVKQTGQISATLKVAGVASLVKLVNVVMPFTTLYQVINPAIAIFLEGLVTWGFCVFLQKNRFSWRMGIPIATLIVFSSICLFRGWQIFMDAFVVYNPKVHRPFDTSILFLWTWRSLLQGLMLVGAVYLTEHISININFSKWTGRLALPLLLISIILTVFV
jgi:hypothetical protein